MIEVTQLVKNYGRFRAVDDLSFTVPKGQVLGFLGPNGAGKSTTMKVISGSLAANNGTVLIDGIDVTKNPIEAQKKIGYLPESAPSYSEMTVSEFLEFVANIRGLTGSEKEKALERVKEQCFLEDVWDALIETLSKGYRQRVGFAQAVIHDPPVLILDEPTDGLDPNQKHEVRRFIKTLGKEKTIILSTHILEEVEALCSRVIIISGGKLLTDKAPEELAQDSSDFNSVTLKLPETNVGGALTALQGGSLYSKVEEVSHQQVKVWPKDKNSIVQSVLNDIQEHKLKVENVYVSQGKLDEVFRNITLPKEGTST